MVSNFENEKREKKKEVNTVRGEPHHPIFGGISRAELQVCGAVSRVPTPVVKLKVSDARAAARIGHYNTRAGHCKALIGFAAYESYGLGSYIISPRTLP